MCGTGKSIGSDGISSSGKVGISGTSVSGTLGTSSGPGRSGTVVSKRLRASAMVDAVLLVNARVISRNERANSGHLLWASIFWGE